MNRKQIIVIFIGILFGIAAYFVNPHLLIRFLEQTVVPDHTISERLARQIIVVREAVIVFSILLCVFAFILPKLPKPSFSKKSYIPVFMIHLVINAIMLLFTAILLFHRVADTWGFSEESTREYLLTGDYALYCTWAEQLPEDARILAVNHNPPWFLSYYLYPRLVFMYERDSNSTNVEEIPVEWLKKRKIRWIINDNKLSRIDLLHDD